MPPPEEKITGALYGSLFTAYDEKLFDESVGLFFTRQQKWETDLEWFRGKRCLDAGCGGGRFVVALAKLDAAEVVGIDISADAVGAANARITARGLSNARTLQASVLEIPFPDHSFDYVISSGVIHHTPDPKHGFDELVRVLKPGGTLFLSVYGRGGLVWFINDVFRYSVCKILPFRIMEKLWAAVGIPANKRYNYLDNLYVPYCYRYAEKEIRAWLTNAGFDNIRRVKFERYDYERPWSRFLHGEGWIQVIADKKI